MLGLASELRADAASARFPAALSTGLVIAVLMVVVQTSIAAIIFSGPLVPFVGQGTGAILFGAFAMCLIVALSGTYKGTISVPHFAPAAALFGVGGGVAASMTAAPEEAVFATMVVIIALSALTTALLFGLVGWFRLANLSRFMPYPLVGGFLGGLGWFLILSGVSITCGITLNWETFPELLESDMVWRWGPSLAFALALLVATKLRPHYLILPASVVLAVGLCHAVLFLFGISVEEARAAGILFVGLPTDASWPPLQPGDLGHVNWGVVASQFPGILGVTLIALMCIVLNAGALELGSGAELDMNREFRVEGGANLIAGLGGSAPGCNTAVMSLVSHATGARTRLTGVVTAFALGAMLFFGGDALAILPKPLLGGLVFFLGLGLLNDWLVASRKTLPWTDYAIVLVVSIVIGVFGFLEGVAVGLVAAVIFFVVRFSGVDVIGASFTARDRQSKRARSATHRAILRHHGERVRAYRLRGYIIFGNASPMGHRLKQALSADPAPLCLLLDFAAVSGFDVSAANIVFRSVRTAGAQGTHIVLSAVAEHVRSILRRGLPEGEWRSLIFEEDLDRGLERCEDLVIAEWDRVHAGSDDARDALFGLSIDHALREVERQARFEALTERLTPWLQSRAYETGETIVARGEEQEGIQFLTQGRAMAREEDAGARMDEYGPGDALAAEAAFADHVAEMTVLAVEPCRTVLMTPSARRSLERDNLGLTVELDRYLIETILEYRARLLSVAPNAPE